MKEYSLNIKGNEATFSLPITKEMINFFRLSTRDTNEIHDSSKTEKPFVLGFQLTSILDQAARQLIRELHGKNYYFKSQKIKFRGYIKAGDTIEAKLTANKSKVITEINSNGKECIKASSIEYSCLDLYNSLKLKFFNIFPIKIDSSFFLKKHLEHIILEKDVFDFYKGIGLDKTNISEIPIPFLLALSSATLKQELESRKEEIGDKNVIYSFQNINVNPQILNIKFGESILIGMTNIEKKHGNFYDSELKVISRDNLLLYQSKVRLALFQLQKP